MGDYYSEDEPFGWQGRAGFFGGGWQNRARAQRGDIGPIILRVLSQKPMHGYEIIRTLEERSHGMWRPSAGSVYPTLQMLEEQELVTSHEEGGKKIYAITEKGTAEAKSAETKNPWEERSHKHAQHFRELGPIIHDIMIAMKQIGKENSVEKWAEVQTILEETRQRLNELTTK